MLFSFALSHLERQNFKVGSESHSLLEAIAFLISYIDCYHGMQEMHAIANTKKIRKALVV